MWQGTSYSNRAWPSTEPQATDRTINGTIQQFTCHFPLFGQLGYIAIPIKKEKLADKGQPSLFLGMIYIEHIIVQTMHGQNHRVRIQDYHPIEANTDHTSTIPASFPTYASNLRVIPTHIIPGTHAPLTLAQSTRYPYDR